MQIIFATGFRTSLPFLADYHNKCELYLVPSSTLLADAVAFLASTIKGHEEPDTKLAPIITDGTHLRSLHWTGHYIEDPTLAFTLRESHFDLIANTTCTNT